MGKQQQEEQLQQEYRKHTGQAELAGGGGVAAGSPTKSQTAFYQNSNGIFSGRLFV